MYGAKARKQSSAIYGYGGSRRATRNARRLPLTNGKMPTVPNAKNRSRLYEIGGEYYRVRRGKWAKIPDAWLGTTSRR